MSAVRPPVPGTTTPPRVGEYDPKSASTFRTCPVTGRRIERGGEIATQVHAVTAIVFLLVGTIAAIGLVLTRWQAVHLLSATWYYRLLGVHEAGGK